MLFPISFSIPKEKICENYNVKTKILSSLIPGDLSTYIYNTEEEYYNEYKTSYFAITTKKAGWDCMRHYEILSVQTLLYFPKIENKPKLTMSSFPVRLQLNVNNIFQNLMLSDNNIDTLENIRLKYYSKSKIKYGLRRVNTKLSKLKITKNNLHKIEQLNKEFNYWFLNYGTTDIYNKIFS